MRSTLVAWRGSEVRKDSFSARQLPRCRIEFDANPGGVAGTPVALVSMVDD
jgi:hypothetical protein